MKSLGRGRCILATLTRIFIMLSLSVQTISISVTTASFLDLNITRFPSGFSNSALRPLSALPNPYRVPDSPISLDFYDQNVGPVFSRTAIKSVINKARQDVVTQIVSKGDTHIAWGTHQSKWGVLAIVYESRPPNRIMTYSDVLVALRGLAIKESADGNRYRLATVYFVSPGGVTMETGDIGLVESVASVDTS